MRTTFNAFVQVGLVGLCLASASSAGLANTSEPADFVYNGYMRSGIGASRGGADQTCFSLPGASAKFRLGNECETYIEATFRKHHTVAKGAPKFSTNLNLALVSGARKDWESTDARVESAGTQRADGSIAETTTAEQDLTLSLREAYVLGEGALLGANAWIGKRFYRRHDIHILDYYIINNSGPGAGLENIDLGGGKLHVAVTRNSATGPRSAVPAQTNLDLRYGMKMGDGSDLEFIAIQGASGKGSSKSGDKVYAPVNGTMLGVIGSSNAWSGTNRVTAQVGMGLFGGDGRSKENTIGSFGDSGSQGIIKSDTDTVDARKKSRTTRVVLERIADIEKQWSYAAVALWQSTDFGGYKDAAGKEVDAKSELMIGTRPVYHFNEHSSLALEYGMSRVSKAVTDKDGKAADATLHKLTVAPQLTSATGFWARPQLRLFGTWAQWNEEASGEVGGGVYSSGNSGFSTGAQLEAWW